MVTSPSNILTKTGKKYPYVQVSIRIYDSAEVDFVTITENCLVDTGFSGDILLASTRLADLKIIGKKTVDFPAKLAGGKRAVAKCCSGFLTHLNDYEFPMNSMDVSVLFLGDDEALVGLNLLRSWISQFHGPEKILTIFNT